MRWQFWLIFVPVAVIVIALSVVNRDPVAFSLGFGSAWQVPLFLLLLAAALLGILFGGIGAWFAGAGGRRRARLARADATQARDALEAEQRKTTRLEAELEAARSGGALPGSAISGNALSGDDDGRGGEAPALTAPRGSDAA